jgi:hypothetical protein
MAMVRSYQVGSAISMSHAGKFTVLPLVSACEVQVVT